MTNTDPRHRILWISPVGDDRSVEDVESILTDAKRPGTEVTVTALDRGPHHVEHHYFEALVLPDTLHRIKRAEQDGYDAVVIGCFYDLGLDAARELTESMAITAPAEATTHLATTMGDRFSVLVGRRKWVPQMRERIHRYGYETRLASLKPVDLGVLDFQEHPEKTESRLRAAAREAVEEDGAEVLILGCTAEYGFYQALQSELGVPVLDAVTAPFKFAELLAELHQFGWHHSKIGGYASPSREEIDAWGLTEAYATADVWRQRDTASTDGGERSSHE